MIKRMLCLLLALLICPLWAGAELEMLEMDVAKNYITFPGLDGMKGYFRKSSDWTIVHYGNYEEHMELLLARGDTEDEIRARFESESLLWEAYKKGLPADACFRMERFVDDTSLDVWHLRHLSTKERKAFLAEFNDGRVFDQYDTFSAKYAGSGGAAYIDCGFTTVPPAAYESGKMHIRYINGQQYVLSYVVRGRMASRSKLRSTEENDAITGHSPFNTLTFGVKLQPQMVSLTLDEPLPLQAELGELPISGTVPKGAAVSITLDGAQAPCTVDKNGTFSAALSLTEPGEHEVFITVTHSKYTDRCEAFVIHASADRTPLTLIDLPEEGALAGDNAVSGTTAPGAAVTLTLDAQEPVILTADAEGSFRHVFHIMDDQAHLLTVTALADGKDESRTEHAFYTEYETFKDGTKAFEKKLTSLSVSELAAAPAAHAGERVKISVRVKEVIHTDTGLGILANYNPPKGSKHAKTPLYLTLYGYGQDQITPDMTMTIYATVQGLKELDGETRMELLMQYGTYLVVK